MTKHMTMRGEIIDFNRLRLDHGDQIPLGNAPINAKGDLISEEGIVLKTEEQLEAEYQARVAENKEPPRPVDIKSNESIITAVSDTKISTKAKQLEVDDANFDPILEEIPSPISTPKARRKIVESED